jgi:hypothetical protein
MRILIRNSASKKYLTSRVAWTSAPGGGRDFPTVLWAYDIARHVVSGRFEVVLEFPASGEVVNALDGLGQGIHCPQP